MARRASAASYTTNRRTEYELLVDELGAGGITACTLGTDLALNRTSCNEENTLVAIFYHRVYNCEPPNKEKGWDWLSGLEFGLLGFFLTTLALGCQNICPGGRGQGDMQTQPQAPH